MQLEGVGMEAEPLPAGELAQVHVEPEFEAAVIVGVAVEAAGGDTEDFTDVVGADDDAAACQVFANCSGIGESG